LIKTQRREAEQEMIVPEEILPIRGLMLTHTGNDRDVSKKGN